MKKSIIAAGAASVALAAMPIVGAFATNGSVGNNGDLVDTLVLSIEDNCTFSRKHTTSGNPSVDDNGHPAGAGAPTGASWTTAGADTDTFEATVLNGQTYNDIAKSAFNVVCNNVKGYQVTVAATGFTTTDISGAESWAYNGGSYAASGSSWYITSSHAGASLSGTNNIAAELQSATNSDDFTITYNVKVSNTQQAADYTATATYTFAELT